MFRRRWLQREKLRAVHDDDLRGFLSSIGVLDQVVAGSCHCAICNAQVTMENLGAVYPEDNKINFVCERHSCLGKANLTEEGSNG